jgi:hypothetical protein
MKLTKAGSMGGVLRDHRGLTVLAVCALVAGPGFATGQQPDADVWAPVRFMLGEWEGRAAGEAGTGIARRTYEFVIRGRYLHEKNVSTYPPQAANQAGEVHEHWSFFSYDRQRKALVLRQFHQEGFVNQYVMSVAESRPGRLVFTSERFENVGDGWRATETYEIRSPDEFVETFELGAPGKDPKVYSRNEFARVKGPSRPTSK